MIEIPFTHNTQEYSLSITSRIDDVTHNWNQIALENIYMLDDYLSHLEKYGPIAYCYYYAVAKKGSVPVGIIYFQRKKVDLSKDFRIHAHSKNIFTKLRVSFLKTFFKFIKNDILIMGNVLLTGEYAFKFVENIDESEKNIFLKEALLKVKEYIKNVDSINIKTTLVKDFYTSGDFKKNEFSLPAFTEFVVQPNMILPLDSSWDSYQDFLAAVKSKYRVKYNKVISKAKDLEFKELDEEMMESHNAAIYALYEATADRALFSLFKLNEPYFKQLKHALKDKVNIYGVFLEGKLIAFYTFIQNGINGDAHFLGYNVSLNSKYQLYFNILLKLIDLAISKKVEFLNLSRTALEIKSSVGAQPYDMNIYLQYHNQFVNKQLPWLLDKIVPKNNWQQRSPFR